MISLNRSQCQRGCHFVEYHQKILPLTFQHFNQVMSTPVRNQATKLLDLNDDCLRAILEHVDWPQLLQLEQVHPRLGVFRQEIIDRRRHISLSFNEHVRSGRLGRFGRKKRGKGKSVDREFDTSSVIGWSFSQYIRYVKATFHIIEDVRFVQRQVVPDLYHLQILFGRLSCRNCWADHLKSVHLELHSVNRYDFAIFLQNINLLPRLTALTFITRSSPMKFWPNETSFDVLSQLTDFEMGLQIKWKRFRRMPRLEANILSNNKLRLFKISLEDLKVTAKKTGKDGTWQVTTKEETLLFWKKSYLQMALLKLDEFLHF